MRRAGASWRQGPRDVSPRRREEFMNVPGLNAGACGMRLLWVVSLLAMGPSVRAQSLETEGGVEGQPLAANIERVVRALETLGAPLPGETVAALTRANAARDGAALQ